MLDLQTRLDRRMTRLRQELEDAGVTLGDTTTTGTLGITTAGTFLSSRAITLGALGAWIGARRAGLLLPPIADAIAPGIALAQAIGRWGNYFNQELFGSPTSLPWGLEIDPAHRPVGYEQFATFHPTFSRYSYLRDGSFPSRPAPASLPWAERLPTTSTARTTTALEPSERISAKSPCIARTTVW